MDELGFRAMGSACRIVVDGVADGAAMGRALVAALEARWSRFVATSEVCWMNRHAGRPVLVSAPTFELVDKARFAHEWTGGRFDPLVLDAVEAAGYDRSHEHLAGAPALPDASSQPDDGGWDASGTPIALDPGIAAVHLPAGRRFDPGGIGKGLAADRVATALVDAGATWVLVDLGGDLRFAGADLAARGWIAQVAEHPGADGLVGQFRVFGGGVATSSTRRRRWRRGDGTAAHHLIDPRTGRPSASTVRTATVIAGETWWAEVVAKALVVGGIDEWTEGWLADRHAEAIVIDTAGRVHRFGTTHAWEQCA